MGSKKGRVPWNKGLSNLIEIKCKRCNERFKRKPSELKRKSKPQYCSRKCYLQGENMIRNKGKHWKLSEVQREKHSDAQIGEKNHNWKGGITEKRKQAEYRKFIRHEKRERKFMCNVCGKIDKGNILHHLNGYKEFPEERMKRENLVCLCEKHHQKFHKKYGYGKNTKSQFLQWMEETERVIEVKKEILQKGEIFNISLEGNSPFFANGILTHNTPPGVLGESEKEQLGEWAKRHGLPKGPVIRKIEKEGIKVGTPENPLKTFSGYYRPFLRTALMQSIGDIKTIVKGELS
jgi:hypothetical protein